MQMGPPIKGNGRFRDLVQPIGWKLSFLNRGGLKKPAANISGF